MERLTHFYKYLSCVTLAAAEFSSSLQSGERHWLLVMTVYLLSLPRQRTDPEPIVHNPTACSFYIKLA